MAEMDWRSYLVCGSPHRELLVMLQQLCKWFISPSQLLLMLSVANLQNAVTHAEDCHVLHSCAQTV